MRINEQSLALLWQGSLFQEGVKLNIFRIILNEEMLGKACPTFL